MPTPQTSAEYYQYCKEHGPVAGEPHRRSNRKWDAVERDLAEAQATLAEIRKIVHPDWLNGRVLPAYVGAGNNARIHAIVNVLYPDGENS